MNLSSVKQNTLYRKGQYVNLYPLMKDLTNGSKAIPNAFQPLQWKSSPVLLSPLKKMPSVSQWSFITSGRLTGFISLTVGSFGTSRLVGIWSAFMLVLCESKSYWSQQAYPVGSQRPVQNTNCGATFWVNIKTINSLNSRQNIADRSSPTDFFKIRSQVISKSWWKHPQGR